MADAKTEGAAVSLLLKNISLRLASFSLELTASVAGPVTVLFGPSGSGKTSLLDLIAGLRKPDSALIRLDDRTLTDTTEKIFVRPRQRRIGYVPQDLALFPHLSVRKNLVYGVQSDEASRIDFAQVVELFQIDGLLDRGVTEISGGEKQRVALARALLACPRLLLLDEPLASLDRGLKEKILPYLALIRDEFRIPMLYVTHERSEAMALGNEVILLEQGRVVQAGPAEILK
jgi:molybdate transport system ATP-binding protein